MPVNNFLPFCPVDTGTNLESQSDYAADSNRTDGNQPGVAKSKLNNKALRQGTYIASQLAQFLAQTTGTDVLDDATPAKLLAQMLASLAVYPPKVSIYTSSTGTHNPTYIFFIVSGNATAAATYTNNSITFTVVTTVAAGTLVKMTGPGAPLASGTLTKTGGTGDSTLSFYAVRAPIYMQVELVGGGGGGGGSQGGSGSSGGAGGAGNDTSFGTTLLLGSAGGGGSGGGAGGSGGAASVGAATGIAIPGANGSDSGIGVSSAVSGGNGGGSPFGGAGQGRKAANGIAASANSGSGGGGSMNSNNSGGGGGAGGYVKALIFAAFTTYPWSVGTGGTAGTAGTAGNVGSVGAAGLIIVTEVYQ